MMVVWLLKIIHMESLGILTERTEEMFKLFSRREEAEKWLVKQGFVYGKCDYFVQEEAYWFHQKDRVGDYVIVKIEEKIMDDFDEKIEWIDSLAYRELKRY